MAKKLITALLWMVLLLCSTSLHASQIVNVSWSGVENYTSQTHGSEAVTQFTLKFDTLTTYGFCVAPTLSISQGNYNYSFLNWTNDYLQAAWLMDQYAATSTTVDTRKETVAVQSAIWNAVTNDAGYLPVSSDSAATLASSMMTALGSATLDESYLKANYKILNNYKIDGTYQTLVIKYPSAVPVPAAVWMLGSGLIAIIGIRRRNRA